MVLWYHSLVSACGQCSITDRDSPTVPWQHPALSSGSPQRFPSSDPRSVLHSCVLRKVDSLNIPFLPLSGDTAWSWANTRSLPHVSQVNWDTRWPGWRCLVREAGVCFCFAAWGENEDAQWPSSLCFCGYSGVVESVSALRESGVPCAAPHDTSPSL